VVERPFLGEEEESEVEMVGSKILSDEILKPN
jgi:hypothetical protein